MFECLECHKQCHDEEFLARHLKSHGIKFRDYTLKWKHNGVVPLCACGCGEETNWNVSLRDFTTYAHGHHALGHVKSDETKVKIGQKNSINMKAWCEANPELAQARGNRIQSVCQTPEARHKRIESLTKFFASDDSKEYRRLASERAIKMLNAGIIGPQAPYRAEWVFNPFTGQEEYMHSSWETEFLQRCIQDDLYATKDHDIRIPYIDVDGTERVYVPDFFLPDAGMLVEVKGLETDTDRAKAIVAAEWCSVRGLRYEYLTDNSGLPIR